MTVYVFCCSSCHLVILRSEQYPVPNCLEHPATDPPRMMMNYGEMEST